MNCRIVEQFTPALETEDYVVFLKTNFQSPILNAKGNVVKWKQDDDNYVYGMFPNRKTTKNGMMAESYMKPQGKVMTWKDKLEKFDTMELDALSEDLPASWDEFQELLSKMVAENTIGGNTIVIRDAATWQKLRAARKRLLRKQMDAVLDEGGREVPYDAPICDPYPLVGIGEM